MNKFTLKFKSEFLERTYINEQIPTLIKFHRNVSLFIEFMLTFIFLFTVVTKNLIPAVTSGFLFFINIGQYLYFRKYRSIKFMIVIVIINIAITCERLMIIIYPQFY